MSAPGKAKQFATLKQCAHVLTDAEERLLNRILDHDGGNGCSVSASTLADECGGWSETKTRLQLRRVRPYLIEKRIGFGPDSYVVRRINEAALLTAHRNKLAEKPRGEGAGFGTFKGKRRCSEGAESGTLKGQIDVTEGADFDAMKVPNSAPELKDLTSKEGTHHAREANRTACVTPEEKGQVNGVASAAPLPPPPALCESAPASQHFDPDEKRQAGELLAAFLKLSWRDFSVKAASTRWWTLFESGEDMDAIYRSAKAHPHPGLIPSAYLDDRWWERDPPTAHERTMQVMQHQQAEWEKHDTADEVREPPTLEDMLSASPGLSRKQAETIHASRMAHYQRTRERLAA